MELQKAQGLVTYNLYKYKLLQKGWRFRWQNKKVSLGTCSYAKKQIRLSKWYVELNDEKEVRDTILHEVAHALSYIRHGRKGIGHGKLWKDICREIGAIPRACSKEKLNKPQNHYKYIDTCCGLTFKRHRLKRNVSYSCLKCHVPVFVSKKQKMVDRATRELLKDILSA